MDLQAAYIALTTAYILGWCFGYAFLSWRRFWERAT